MCPRPLCQLGFVLLVIAGGCAPPAAAPAGPKVKLSAAVALGQTTVEGTLMMFSVDYRFLGEAAPAADRQYAWVIVPAKGEPLEQVVKLGRRNTLQAIAPQWRTEHGPFTCHIVEIAPDGTRETISENVTMR